MNKLKVLIVAQYAPIWPSLRSVWQALNQNANVDLKVIKTQFLQPIASENYMEKLDALFTAERISTEPDTQAFIDSFNPHLVFIQNPYEATRIPILRTKVLHDRGCRVAYVPYGIEMGGGEKNYKAQFNTDLQHYAWRVFLRSERNKAMYAKHCAVGDVHAVVTGHPKFDNQQDFATYPISATLKAKIAGRKVILWSPHFSVGLPPSWSSYRIYNQTIMQQIEARPDVFFIIRPHPLFFKEMLRQQVWDEQGEADFRKLCEEKDNLWLDEEADYMESFAASNAIMTDVGSFLLEYLPTKNPIMYLHHPEGFGLNDDGDLVDHYYRANLPEDIPPFIDMVSKGVDPMRDERVSITDEFLYGLDGKVGQRIADHIVKELTQELNATEWHTNPNSDEALQNKNNYYWKNASNTLNAPPAFYELKDKAFKEALNLMHKVNYAVDVGCGEGKYTLPLSSKCNQLDAFDISPKLIHTANKRKEKFNLNNITFTQANYGEMQLSQPVDLFSCNEIASCIIDNKAFAKLFNAIYQHLSPQGKLLFIDQFSLAEDKTLTQPSGLTLKLRNLQSVTAFLSKLGFKLITNVTILEKAQAQFTVKQLVLEK